MFGKNLQGGYRLPHLRRARNSHRRRGRDSGRRRGRNLFAWALLGLPLRPSNPSPSSESGGLRIVRWGAWWGRHSRFLRVLVVVALSWSLAYLTWRIGWSLRGASPILWGALLLAELYGCWNLAMLAWLTWELPEINRPASSPGRRIDVYVCTYDEPLAVLEATLAGCALLAYQHVTYVLDDGHRAEVAALAHSWGARYLTRPNNEHAKAGNVNHALSRTEGELVFVLDADHVPLPDALDTLVGYFRDPRVALVQGPHDFFNHDSVQHYDLGRHEQSVFYSVISRGKDRHNAAFWCGSGALIRRSALREVGGVATETITEDFHTTIKLHRAGWRTRYDPRVVLQGRAPHDLAAYLLQRDRWARGNLSVFATPESPLRGRGLTPAQRLSYLASLSSYLAGPARLLILVLLAAVLWTGALPLQMAPLALALLWAPASALMVLSSSALCRGEQSGGETIHYELSTAEIFTRALRCVVRPGRTSFRVTPKRGIDPGGWVALRQFRLLLVCAVLLAGGLIVRIADDAGANVTIIAHLHGFAAWFAPLLGAIELRRVLRTLTLVTRRRQLRIEYRTPLVAAAVIDPSPGESMPGKLVLGRITDIALSGIGLELAQPLAVGSTVEVTVQLPTIGEDTVPVKLGVFVHACVQRGEHWRIGASIVSFDSEAHRRIVEYCHIIWPYQRLRGSYPTSLPETEIAAGLAEPSSQRASLQQAQ
jgi:cellulose synthase (UDP-forming)